MADPIQQRKQQLDHEKAREVLKLLAQVPSLGQKAIAVRLNVSISVISNIAQGHSHKLVNPAFRKPWEKRTGWQQAASIIDDLMNYPEVTQQEIADFYGVTVACVSSILSRKNWKSLWECHDRAISKKDLSLKWRPIKTSKPKPWIKK